MKNEKKKIQNELPTNSLTKKRLKRLESEQKK